MTRLYILRHGNTFDPGDTVTRVGARTDLPLSTSGQDQARRLAAHFVKHEPFGFAQACCSSLIRTRQTAETILAASANPPSLRVLPFLTEIDYGPDENQPEEKVEARIGRAAVDLWDEQAIPPPGWVVEPESLITAWRAMLKTLSADAPDRPILLVTSNGIARFALDLVTTGRSRASSIKLKTGAFGTLSLSEGTVELVNWNQRPTHPL